MTTADGRRTAVEGSVSLKVKIGNLDTIHPFYVTDKLAVEAVIGADFLTRNKIRVDMGLKQLHIHDSTVPLIEHISQDATILLSVVSKIFIPSHSETLVRVQCKENPTNSRTGFVEGSNDLARKDLLAAKGLASVSKFGETWIRIVNLDDKPKILHQNEQVGTFTPVTEDIEVHVIEAKSTPSHNSQPHQSAPIDNSEPTIQDIDRLISQFDLDTTELSSQQKIQVAKLLAKHETVISKGDWDLGKTTKGEFKIELNDEFPICEPVRKIIALNREISFASP
jgi:hypothetical protein